MPQPSHLSLKRDQQGRIAERTIRFGNVAETRRYAYDSAGRLSRVTDASGALCESYQYDPQGRRLAEINPARFRGERRYTYLSGNRLGQARTADGGNAQYGHDRAGFRNLKVVGDAETHYRYEPSGLLMHVDLPDGRKVQYVYDANGLRLEKRVTVNGVGRLAEAFRWLDPLRLEEFHDGRQWWLFAYLEGRTPVGLTNGQDMYYILADQLGTPVALATADGHIVQTMQYDSFGTLLQVRGDVVRLPIGFAGGLFDADTGLTRFVWRDYDADTGRFTALDPLGKKGGDNDWYGYCVDDPVNWVDDWGLWTGAVGFDVSGSIPGFGGTAGVKVGRDGDANWRLQPFYGYGAATGIGASVGGFGEYTNAKKIDDLAGEGWQIGGTGGGIGKGMFKGGWSIGSDKVGGNGYDGTSVSASYGVGGPGGYVYETNTGSYSVDDLPKFEVDLTKVSKLEDLIE